MSRRAAMLRAAMSYVQAGWPIVPGAMPADGEGRGWGRMLTGGRPVACFCRRAECSSPAAHPLGPDWRAEHVLTQQSARFWWDRNRGPLPNIVLCCGESFDAWSVPARVGSAALSLIDADLAPWAPVAISPVGRWYFFTAPELGRPALTVPPGLDVVRLGAGCFVPAPPSDRGPMGRDRWLIAPRRRRLPAGWTVAAALILATQRSTACDRQEASWPDPLPTSKGNPTR